MTILSIPENCTWATQILLSETARDTQMLPFLRPLCYSGPLPGCREGKSSSGRLDPSIPSLLAFGWMGKPSLYYLLWVILLIWYWLDTNDGRGPLLCLQAGIPCEYALWKLASGLILSVLPESEPEPSDWVVLTTVLGHAVQYPYSSDMATWGIRASEHHRWDCVRTIRTPQLLWLH